MDSSKQELEFTILELRDSIASEKAKACRFMSLIKNIESNIPSKVSTVVEQNLVSDIKDIIKKAKKEFSK